MKALFALVLLGSAGDLSAQVVRGQLTDSISRSPLSSAFLTLVDEHGTERARAITNAAGQFTLTAPTAGTYRIRSKRIGFRPYVSTLLELRSGETVSFNAAVDPIPVPLEQVVVAGDRQCDVESGASVAALWEEVEEALAAVAWTSREPGYWYQVTQFEREVFTQDMRQGLDSTWRNAGFYQVPFRAVPAEQLEREGFVLVDEEGWTYHEPDADVLISTSFLRTHCFETKVGKGETAGLVGLGFQPARNRRLSDITGTLWVDRHSGELRHLEFKYVRLPQGLSAPNAGGRVEFMRVPTGAWMVRDWIIRMAIAEEGRTPTGSATFLRTVGYRERGGSAVEIKTTGGAVVYRSAATDSIQSMAVAPPPPPQPQAVSSPPPAPPVVVAAPASASGTDPTRPSTASRSRDVLLPDEFVSTTARDAYGLVQQYRPNWLRSRGRTSFQNDSAGLVQLYVNGQRWGEIERLREISLVDVLELRYRNGQEATMRYGNNHAGGVIEVRTR
ncbi:MAG TPA: carboxypeptidase-like regulatory domain-containing protein [Gemmatimonadales bacterium]|nr:carboxypeptidase-like regulatory domain-containing protein [Gemmatimonadales bacterium]